LFYSCSCVRHIAMPSAAKDAMGTMVNSQASKNSKVIAPFLKCQVSSFTPRWPLDRNPAWLHPPERLLVVPRDMLCLPLEFQGVHAGRKFPGKGSVY